MTDIFANGPSASGGGAPGAPQQSGDVTGTLAELERKLRELERELTSIGRRRELAGTSVAAQAVPESPAQTGAKLVDEALEPSVEPLTPSEPPAPSGSLAPNEPPAPSEPFGSGQPVKFVRPLESARQSAAREPARRVEPRTPSEPQPAGELSERPRPSEAQLASLAELRRFRDRLERLAKDLASEYDALLGRVMTGLTSASPPAAPAPSETAPAAPPVPPPPPPAPSPEDALFEGRVELGVGPFYDIASLSAFERQLTSLPHVAEASVRRFEASHAVVDVRLAAPVALVQELRRTAGTDFSIREVADGRILLTFDDS
jgi:hypothetical protein